MTHGVVQVRLMSMGALDHEIADQTHDVIAPTAGTHVMLNFVGEQQQTNPILVGRSSKTEHTANFGDDFPTQFG